MRIMNNMKFDLNMCNVIDKWGELGYLDYVEEGDKKYLADLYESLEDWLTNKRNARLNENINLRNEENSDYLEYQNYLVYQIMKKCYNSNKTFSFNEFVEHLDVFYVNALMGSLSDEETSIIANNILSLMSKNNNE